ERTLRRRRPSVHHGSPWDVILLKIIGRRGLPLLALLRAAIAVIPLAAHQRHVRHPQGEVRLAVILAGAEFAGHAQLRTLRDVLANLGEAVAPGAAIQPERLLLVAEAAVHGQRKPCHQRVAGLSGHRVLPDTADCVEVVHSAFPLLARSFAFLSADRALLFSRVHSAIFSSASSCCATRYAWAASASLSVGLSGSAKWSVISFATLSRNSCA